MRFFNIIFHVFILAAYLLLSSCGGIPKGNLPSKLFIKNSLSNPMKIEAEFVVKVKVNRVFSGDELRQYNIKNNIPEEQPPTLLLWRSDIIDRTNQRDVKHKSLSIKPTLICEDKQNGNRILFWDFSKDIIDGKEFSIKQQFTYTVYEYNPKPDYNIVMEKWNEIPTDILAFYTKDESFLEQSEAMRQKSSEIVGAEKNPLRKAELIYNWVINNMTYKYPPEKRGALEALDTLLGDCGQYSDLFITLARCAGIPARLAAGFYFAPDGQGYHVWSEIYLPDYGWIPVDATFKKGFCRIDNNKLTVSTGMNIHLPNVPAWASYKNNDVEGAENGRTDFMQMVSSVISGADVSISTERKILKHRP